MYVLLYDSVLFALNAGVHCFFVVALRHCKSSLSFHCSFDFSEYFFLISGCSLKYFRTRFACFFPDSLPMTNTFLGLSEESSRPFPILRCLLIELFEFPDHVSLILWIFPLPLCFFTQLLALCKAFLASFSRYSGVRFVMIDFNLTSGLWSILTHVLCGVACDPL